MPPITLTPAQFAQTAAAQKPGATYGTYRAFIAARRAMPNPSSAAPPPVDPLAQWTTPQINAIIARTQNQMGAPLTEAQIQANAQGQITPLIAAITKSANDKAAAAGQAIKGLTDSYASMLGQENFAAPYQGAEQGQAAVDAALQQSLTGAGSSLASDLSSRLGVINDPTTAAAASGLAARGAALGTNELASGSSALSQLISNAASAKEYGLKQPVIARNAGIQGLEQAQGQAQSEIAAGTQSALSQLPGIVQALEQSNASLRANRAQAAASLLGTLTGQNISKATIAAGIQDTNTRATATQNAAITRANAAANARAAASAKPSAAMTKQFNDGYLHDSNGNVVTRGGQPVRVPIKPASGSSGGFSAAALQRYHGQAVTIIGDATEGYSVTSGSGLNAKTTHYGRVNRATAKERLDRAGVPPRVYLPLLDAAYQPQVGPGQPMPPGPGSLSPFQTLIGGPGR